MKRLVMALIIVFFVASPYLIADEFPILGYLQSIRISAQVDRTDSIMASIGVTHMWWWLDQDFLTKANNHGLKMSAITRISIDDPFIDIFRDYCDFGDKVDMYVMYNDEYNGYYFDHEVDSIV